MIIRQRTRLAAGWLVLFFAPLTVGRVEAAAQQPASATTEPASQRALLDKYCVRCHNERLSSGNLRLDIADLSTVGEHSALWEKVVRKLRVGLMPPPRNPRPDKTTYDGFASWLEQELDRYALAYPNPGRTESFHRLNRTEYTNIVRDLLGLEMDFTDLLPMDDSGGGQASFDNIASSLHLTQSLFERYLSVARKVARTAVGSTPPAVELVFKTPPRAPQDQYLEGMLFGTKGGVRMEHFFPVDGEYEFEIVAEDRGMLDFSLDGERIKLIEVRDGPRPAENSTPPPAPEELKFTLPVKAGPHVVTAAYIKDSAVLEIEADRKPYYGGVSIPGNPAARGMARAPGVTLITMRGPLEVLGAGDTPSRARIFTCHPTNAATEESCAKSILTRLARRAYRRPLTEHDVGGLMERYKEGRVDGDFESGVERGIRAMLVNPNFLLRVEADPPNVPPGDVYRISDLELASRLSFFIWSSIPDDQLLDLAVEGQLTDPVVLEQQVRRMLRDPRSESLTKSFAAQWLWVRNLKASRPSEPIFPNFDESLRTAFRQEIELFFDSIVEEDRSVIDLLDADYTFVNERLARHYGIRGVYGTDFRRVMLGPDHSERRGLLGKGALLLVTSLSTRTSPVVRGKWILENLLGAPPPAPPVNVPSLPEQKQNDGRVLSMRELMAKHRANPVCASCHATIDPLGFSLEQFDGIGQLRKVDAGFQPIESSDALPDGSKFGNVDEFRALLLVNRDQFVTTLTDKLMMYALGRTIDYYDGPAIRNVVRDAAASNYRLSAIVLGIVKSTPFQMRKAATAASATQVASLPQ